MSELAPHRRSRGRVLSAVTGFGAFLWDFVVGDDWVGALGVTLLFGLAAVLAHVADVRAWWLLPPGVALVLAIMVRRAVRAASAAARPPAPHR